MSNFLKLMEIGDFINLALNNLTRELATEEINIVDSLDRIVSEDIYSTVDLPPFSRSCMDGYAVKSKDTYGANDTLPVFLKMVGEVKMGEVATQKLNPGECIKIATGAMIPEGSDAVVMVEKTEVVSKEEVEISAAVFEKENIVFAGEDITSGDLLLRKGHKIRPQDIGALAGIGQTKIKVYKKPKVAIISTGDEIIPPTQTPKLGQIRDINSYAIASSVRKIGGVGEICGIVKDNKEELLKKVKSKIKKNDVILLSGGSSVGTRDLTIEVLETLQEDSILAHGIALKPGKPTILSIIDKTLILGLPGHPASSVVSFKNVVIPLIKALSGEVNSFDFQNKITATLNRNIVSEKGREQYFRVLVKKEKDKYIAEPILGKSSLITTLVKANGLLKCPIGSEGITKDKIVEVILFS